MNINSQFPPSSPLLHSENELDSVPIKDGFDLLKGKQFKPIIRDERREQQKEDAYLTPDPSSSLGDVTIASDNSEGDESMIKITANSSPSKLLRVAQDEPENKEEDDEEEEIEQLHSTKKSKPNPSSSIDVSQPLNAKNFKNVMYVPLNGDKFKIGRSGLSCSFKLNSQNKLISRVHAEVQFDKDTQLITLKCLGFNGLNITIPKLISVEHVKEKEYLIKVNGEEETGENLEGHGDNDASKSRILTRSSAFTNFYMLKDESIKMPLIEGTVLDFRGDLALLVYKKDPLNLNIASKTAGSAPPASEPAKRKMSTGELLKIVEEKKLQFSTHPTLNELKSKKQLPVSASGARPIVRKNLANTIIYKRASPAPVDENASKPMVKSVEKKAATTAPAKIKRAPLADITNKHQKATAPAPAPAPAAAVAVAVAVENRIAAAVVKQGTPPPQASAKLSSPREERSKSPEPLGDASASEEQKKRGRPKKVKQTEEDILRSMPKAEVDAVLSTVPELDDISNLVTNHIAYSRILQTPFSSIRELNSIKRHNLSALQLRCLLIHYVACIGVIFRQGKDAAGKPLDEEYYYVPEKDSDVHRVQLVEELKGSSSHLRSCRKTHKQYFWKKPKL